MLQDERIFYIDGLIYVCYMRSLSQKLLLKGYRDRSVMVTSRVTTTRVVDYPSTRRRLRWRARQII